MNQPIMRRTDKEITDRQQIDAIIRGSTVCHLGICRDNLPYVVPLSFGYDGCAIYFHTAVAGRKIDCWLANPNVCFQFECNVALRREGDLPCKWSFSFQSVIGFGVISEIHAPADREYGLRQIVNQYGPASGQFDPPALAKTRMWKVTIASITGKQSQPKQANQL